MPRVIRRPAIQLDAKATILAADRVARNVQVHRQDPAASYQQIVGEDGIDPADAPAARAEEAIAQLDLRAQVLRRHATAPSAATATLTAPGSTVISTGTLPKGSPSRWTRVEVSPSMRTVRAWTISTFGLRRCFAW